MVRRWMPALLGPSASVYRGSAAAGEKDVAHVRIGGTGADRRDLSVPRSIPAVSALVPSKVSAEEEPVATVR